MPKFDRTKQKKPSGDRKHITVQNSSGMPIRQSGGKVNYDIHTGETPFRPVRSKHLDMIARATSADEKASVLSHLQQTYGNKYVQSLVASIAIQAKLNVSQVGDFQELQADKVAEVVSQMIETEIQKQPEEEEEEEEIMQITKTLQRQEEEEVVPSPPEEEEVPAESINNRSTDISGNLERQITGAAGTGHVIPEITRKPMEQAFGVNFDKVRMHTDAEANTLSEALRARAFTMGQDVFFREGEYKPDSTDGRKLLAHELTHVIQQTKGTETINRLQETLHVQSDSKYNKKNKIPVLTLPDPATMGGVVIVSSQKFEAWVSPTAPACIVGGIEAHETKHISDFEADSYYSTIPTSGKIADGHCVYYRNNDDAKKFENAAIDVEIDWLKKKLESNPSEADKRIIENRMNVTLPAYRASFG